MKDPFEAAVEEQESPPESPIPPEEDAGGTSAAADGDEEEVEARSQPAPSAPLSAAAGGGRGKEEDEEEEEENMEELSKIPSSGDPDKLAKMQAILSRFTEEQMSRYESFRRSGFQKANMKRAGGLPYRRPAGWWRKLPYRLQYKHVQPETPKFSLYMLLTSITGTQKISVPMTIVVSGIGKMFVGELVETARMVMTERKDGGPIRPCHIREAYRRLKLEGKIPKRSFPRLFR